MKIEDAKLGEDVIVDKPGFHMHDRLGQIWKVGSRLGEVCVSVSFEGEIYWFHLHELALA